MRMCSSTARGLTATIAIATAVVLLASNFTIINAQQSVTSQPSAIENGITTAATTFQSTNDSFSIQVPQGWVIQDLNNTGSALLNESSQGYGILAQLCPEEEQQGAPPTNNASGGSSTDSTSNSCRGSQEEVIYIIRYPDLDTRIQAASNVTTTASNNNITTDNVQSYHLQKLQEVGYRSPQILNSTDVRLNLTNPQTNETIATVPARLVEMAYSTNTAPAEITTATAASGSLAPTPLPPAVGQVFDSFELIAAPEVPQITAQEEPQAAEFAEGAVDDEGGAGDDDDDGADDDDGGDDDGADDDDGGDDDGADDDDGGDDDGADDDDGGDDDGADDDDGG